VRRSLLVLVCLLIAADAGAQIIRTGIRFREPAAWVSLGVGLQGTFDVVDGSTGTVWHFSDGPQFAASLEKNFSGGVTAGLRGTHSRLRLAYADAFTATDADANVSQVMGMVRVSSGRDFHSVLELSAGTTIYSNFRARSTDQRLAPTSPDADLSFAFGYGLGYNFSPSFAIDVVQDQTTSVHQKTGLSGGEGSSDRVTTTRLIARFGLGGR
jgi:hypothetical protein